LHITIHQLYKFAAHTQPQPFLCHPPPAIKHLMNQFLWQPWSRMCYSATII
jgi:hypothetical protein